MNMDQYSESAYQDVQNINWEAEFSDVIPVWNVSGNMDNVMTEKEKEDEFDPNSFLNEIFSSPEASFKMLPCEKERGLTYLIASDEMLFTKKGVWNAIEVTNFKSGVLDIYERYSEKNHQKSRVVCDNKCAMEIDGFIGLMEDYSFLVKVKVLGREICFSPIYSEGRHIVRINSRDLFKDSDIPCDKFVIYVKYRCRNTCESHKKNGRNRQLVFKHKSQEASLPKEEWFEIRVCEAPKRDLIKWQNKRMPSSDECSNSPKKMKIKHEEQEHYDQIHEISDTPTIDIPDSVIISPSILGLTKEEGIHIGDGTEQNILMPSGNITQSYEFQPKHIVAKMKSEEDEKMVLTFINRLGGEIF